MIAYAFPLEVRSEADGYRFDIYDAHGCWVAACNHEETARLLSAAPDLYGALKEALPILESLDSSAEDGDEPIPLIEEARDALMKADGKENPNV